MQIATTRIDFLKSLSHIAWISRSYESNQLGSIVDIFEAEVWAILASVDTSFIGMRTSIRQKIVQYGNPSEIKTFDEWKDLRPALEAMAVRAQEIASIVHTERALNDDSPIGLLKKISIKDQNAFKQPLLNEIAKLTEDLTNRGDSKLIDPRHTAREFVSTIANSLIETLNRGGSVFDAFIEQHDVLKSDVSDETTLRQFKELARRRQLARIAAKQLGIEFDEVWPKVRDEKIPSEIIQEKIRRARKAAPRASGSDLGDDYLACLAPYVDAVIVDKRTHEFLTQGTRHDSSFAQMVGFFAKVPSYHQLPNALPA